MLCGLAYWTWCWGWWGQNRYLRYFLQCNCPVASEEARYPDDVDVLVSACENPFLSPYIQHASPSGRYTLFNKRNLQNGVYLYDRDSDLITKLPYQSIYAFLDEDLLLRRESDKSYSLYDIKGKQLAPLKIIAMPDDMSFSISALDILRNSAKVYYVLGVQVVALAPGFPQYPETNYIFLWNSDVSVSILDTIPNILHEQGISFERVDARRDTLLIPTEPITPGGPLVIDILPAPNPLLRQRQPLEFYAPNIRTQVEARRQGEQWSKLGANAVAVAGLLIAVGLMGTGVFFRFRARH
jgi:hypothetical protein